MTKAVMDTLGFLSAVWPPKGLYAVASPLKLDDGRTVYPAEVFSSISAVVEHVQLIGKNKDLFFNVHALIERRTKHKRRQDNMRACRVFFFDLDCGEGKPYPTQKDAVAALSLFVSGVGLPDPMLVSSGRGVHAYFRMATEIQSHPWQLPAMKLRKLADHYELKYDPSRTTDTSSLLRIAGSTHLKDRTKPLPVEVRRAGQEIETDDMLARIDSKFDELGLTLKPSEKPKVAQNALDLLGSNTERTYDGPPIPVDALEGACPQIARIVFLRGAVEQPQWYNAMGVIRFTENGEEMCHKLLDDPGSYDEAITDVKLQQLAEFGPTSCATMEKVCGPRNCIGCAYRGKVASPIVAARRFMSRQPIDETPPAPAPGQPLPEKEILIAPISAPAHYVRTTGGIIKKGKDKDNDDAPTERVICQYDLFPIRHLAKTDVEPAQTEWCVTIPQHGQKVFMLRMTTLTDTQQLMSALGNEGIMLDVDAGKELRNYMSAYLRDLQRHQNMQRQLDHLGWTDDDFVLPEITLHPDGSTSPSILSQMAAGALDYTGKAGTLEGQVKALRFFDNARYRPHQFAMLGGLASALLAATDQHGAIVHIHGKSGGSKSTVLFAIGSFWGPPKQYVLNGTKDGVTRNALNDRITTLSNLPLCLDELTDYTHDDAKALAFNITQPNSSKVRLKADATVRKQRTNSKAMLAVTSANVSLQSLLATQNSASDAGAMRVFEIQVEKVDKRFKAQADEFLHQISLNYGHIGEAFLRYVVRNKEAVFKRVRAKMRELDEKLAAEGAERFWSATVACVIVAGEIALALDLLTFDIDALETWLIEEQFPLMRETVVEEHKVDDEANLLATFLAKHADQIIVVSQTDSMAHNEKLSSIIRHPRGGMVAHFNRREGMMYVNYSAFRTWLGTVGKHGTRVTKELMTRRIVVRKLPFTLGLGTEHATSRPQCLHVNMTHPEISEVAPALGGETVVPFKR